MKAMELKLARIRAKKSQQEMADAIEKSMDSYSKKERGLVKFTDSERLVVKEKLGLSWEQFNDIFFDNNLPIGNNSEIDLPLTP